MQSGDWSLVQQPVGSLWQASAGAYTLRSTVLLSYTQFQEDEGRELNREPSFFKLQRPSLFVIRVSAPRVKGQKQELQKCGGSSSSARRI